MNRKVVVTTTYFSEIMNDKDRIITDIFKTENEKEVEQLLRGMEGYIVHSDICREKQADLVKSLEIKDYLNYYKIIKRIAKQAIKELETKR